MPLEQLDPEHKTDSGSPSAAVGPGWRLWRGICHLHCRDVAGARPACHHFSHVAAKVAFCHNLLLSPWWPGQLLPETHIHLFLDDCWTCMAHFPCSCFSLGPILLSCPFPDTSLLSHLLLQRRQLFPQIWGTNVCDMEAGH